VRSKKQSTGTALALGITALGLSAAFAILRTRAARRANPPVGRFVKVDGVRLHYLDVGSGEPLVLLHGNGGLIQDFLSSDLVRLAAQTYRVIVFDRPGYGWSDRPRRGIWTAARQAELLQASTRKLGIERVHLLGHSWGTLVAAEWALRHPERVRSLTLASGYYFPSPRLDVMLGSVPAIPVIGDLIRFTILPLTGRLFWPLIMRKLFGPARMPPHFRTFPRAFALSPLSLRASAEESALMIAAAAALESRYDALRLPVSIVAGAQDRLVSTRRQSTRLHRVIKGSELGIFPGVGHMVHHIEPHGVMRAIQNAAERS
jgi:pimeloyl-ACP methyl ester carboxylesterase